MLLVFQTTLSQLEDVWYHLNETWEDRKQLLTQCYDLQVYEEYAEQADAWLSNKEGFLANEDLGVRLLLTSYLCYFLRSKSRYN